MQATRRRQCGSLSRSDNETDSPAAGSAGILLNAAWFLFSAAQRRQCFSQSFAADAACIPSALPGVLSLCSLHPWLHSFSRYAAEKPGSIDESVCYCLLPILSAPKYKANA
jgi:hypothetical protein